MAPRSTTPGRGLRVLSVSSTAELWGAELALATYLRHRPEGFEPRVLCLSSGPLVDLLRDDGLPATAASLNGRPSLSEAGAFTRRLYADLRRWRPAMVYATGNKAAILCLPAARAANVPLVWHRVDLALQRSTVWAIASATSGVIAVSRASAAAVPMRRFLGVVPPPVRLSESFSLPVPRPSATIGSVGQLHPVKGHHDVIAAAALLNDEFPELRVLIAGGPHPAYPSYPKQLREIALRVGLEDKVELTGHVGRIEDVYERLTVLVSGTYRDVSGVGPEALGAAIAEASWAGLPVVATRGGGTSEVVEHGVTGRLVPPRRPEAMANAIAQYLRDPAAARTAGEAGTELARNRFRPGPLANTLFSSLGRLGARR
jgi:glycosyltransferase involved in cell wall biosynthesis